MAITLAELVYSELIGLVQRTRVSYPACFNKIRLTENMVDKRESYTKEDLLASGRGELFGAKGPQLPAPNMLMMDRVVKMTETGGNFDKGYVEAELDINPDLWFFGCHFIGDPVMPGCLGLDAMWQLVGFYLGEEITYEGYGPAGVAVIVNASTDNKNRTAADVRHIFDKFGGNLGTNGCVSYMFDKKGVIIISKESTNMSEDELMLLSIEAGAENFEAEDEYYEITTTPDDFSSTREELEKNGLEFEQAEITLIPSTYVTLDEEKARKMQLLIEHLEDLDDVLEVYHNWEE